MSNNSLIKAEQTKFTIKDLGFYMDGRLIAIVDGSQYDFMGRKIFQTGFFRKNIGFGITNINIEVNTSLQPIISITFKDLYGNVVFGKDVIDERVPDYSVLFNWPPAKFLFTFKGFLGRQVSWVLNLKKTSTSYQQDGSYDIKCEFIPSQWGFMGDLPFLFLLAVKGLRKNELSSSSFKTQQSIFDLIKIGIKVQTKTKEVTKEFDVLLHKMNLIKSGRIVEAICYSKVIRLDEEIDGTAGNSKIISTQDIDRQITFSSVTFLTPNNTNINTVEKIKEYTAGNAEALRKVNTFLLLNAQIGSRGSRGIQLEDINFESGEYEQLDMRFRNALIDDNIRIIEDAIKKRTYDSTKSQLEKITIGQVFKQIGKDSGYIMGKILEAGALGYGADSEGEDLEASRRREDRDFAVKNKTIIGKQFPLKIDDKTGDEVPAIGLGLGVEKYELNFVDKFITAISQGVAQDLVRENQINGLPDEKRLVKRINNIEAIKGNPYKPFFRNITQNIMIRAGIIAFLTRSNDPNLPGDYDKSFLPIDRDTVEEVFSLATADMENLSNEILNELDEKDYVLLKRFCYYWIRLMSPNGEKILDDNGNEQEDIEGVDFEEEIPQNILNKNVKVDKSDDSITLNISQIYDYVFGVSRNENNDNIGYDKSNAGFISKKTMQAQVVFNNDILYRSPQTNTILNNFVYVIFQGADARKARQINNASSDSEFKGEDPDASGLLGGKKPLLGIVPIDTFYSSSNNSDGSTKEELGRIKFMNDQFEICVLKYSEINNPPSSLFSSDGQRWREVVVYPTTTKIVDPNSNITDINTQIPASNLAVSVAMSPLKEDKNLVFGPFYNSSSGVNHRACIRQMCETIINKMNSLEQYKNKIISDVLGDVIERKSLLYKQFHALYHQWESLLFDDAKNDSIDNLTFPLIKSSTIVSVLEQRYGGKEGDNSRHYSTDSGSRKEEQINALDTNVFVYDYPLNSKANIDVRKSIINLEPLYRPDGNTTVLNIFQQICTKNNFTFIPIPGNGDFNDYLEIFKPQISKTVRIQNLFYVMFTPTPESRSKALNENLNSLVSDEKDFNLNQNAYEVKVGSPDNKIFTNFSVDTYETKVTAESIISTQRVADNENINKKIATDCSQLSVMEGKSYKASFEMIGNAQIFPYQYFYLNSIPLFNGVYQVVSVNHNITPNDMKTSAEGIRMRFSAGELAGVKPVTLDSLENIQVQEL